MAVHISSHKRASAAMSASPLELGDFLCELPALLETPEQIIGMALQFLGDPKDLSEINKQAISQLWNENVSQLRRNPIIASYLGEIEREAIQIALTDQIYLGGAEKFSALYEKMTTELLELDPDGLQTLDVQNRVVDPSFYLELAEQFKSSSLKAAWPVIRDALGHGQGLPRRNATAAVIEDWFNRADPAILQGVARLDFYSKKLLAIPTVIKKFTHLRMLDLEKNRIRALDSDAFVGLTQLRELDLSSNKISVLPAAVFNDLTQLLDLALASNRIADLPAAVFDRLDQLKELYLGDNRIAHPPASIFHRLVRLEALHYSDNQMAHLPAALFDGLIELKELDLEYNHLADLPDVFHRLPKLEKVHLRNNEISVLPDTLVNILTQLTEVDLFNNPITDLSMVY